MPKEPLSVEDKKRLADAYIAIQNEIETLKSKAETLYADFTPSMKTYVQKVAEHRQLEKQVAQKLNRLEEIDKKMGDMQIQAQGLNKRVRDVVDGGKPNTFAPHSDSLVEKNKLSDDKENIPPAAKRPANEKRNNRM